MVKKQTIWLIHQGKNWSIRADWVFCPGGLDSTQADKYSTQADQYSTQAH